MRRPNFMNILYCSINKLTSKIKKKSENYSGSLLLTSSGSRHSLYRYRKLKQVWERSVSCSHKWPKDWELARRPLYGRALALIGHKVIGEFFPGRSRSLYLIGCLLGRNSRRSVVIIAARYHPTKKPFCSIANCNIRIWWIILRSCKCFTHAGTKIWLSSWYKICGGRIAIALCCV